MTHDIPATKKELLQKEIDDLGDSPVTPKPTKETKKEKKDTLALDLEGVVDVLDDNGKLVYLLEDGKVTDKIVIEGKVFTPPEENIPYLFPDKEKVLSLINEDSEGSEGSLYTRLFNYHENISELPNKLFYDLLVLWDVHTYFLDKLHFSPILHFYAVKERGKSRTGKGCIYVSKRGVFTQTIREPDIIRWGHDHKATIGFDVKDFPKKINRANCDDLLLARFEKGSTASRTLYPERGAFRDTKTFNLFGATIVMTNRPVDDVLESRAISIDMKPSDREFENEVKVENALDLKAELTAFAFKHKDTKLVTIGKPANGRLGDILRPLCRISKTFFPDKYGRLAKVINIIGLQKQESATDTFEAQIVETIISAEEQVVKGFLGIDLIASLFNEGKKDRFTVRNSTIGRVIKGLGFTSKRMTGGKKGIYYDEKLVKKIANQYGLTYDSPSLPSLPSPKLTKTESKYIKEADSEKIPF
jgi:hypothetical protein